MKTNSIIIKKGKKQEIKFNTIYDITFKLLTKKVNIFIKNRISIKL